MNLQKTRLDTQGMHHAITAALADYHTQIDSEIQKAVEEFCSEEYIATVVRRVARAILYRIITAELEQFFRYGAGRKAISAAVKESLLDMKGA